MIFDLRVRHKKLLPIFLENAFFSAYFFMIPPRFASRSILELWIRVVGGTILKKIDENRAACNSCHWIRDRGKAQPTNILIAFIIAHQQEVLSLRDYSRKLS